LGWKKKLVGKNPGFYFFLSPEGIQVLKFYLFELTKNKSKLLIVLHEGLKGINTDEY